LTGLKDAQTQPPAEEAAKAEDASNDPEEPAGKVLLCRETAAKLGKALEHPEIEAELERAIWQVEQSNQAGRQETVNSKKDN